jgi:hypothetical protein
MAWMPHLAVVAAAWVIPGRAVGYRVVRHDGQWFSSHLGTEPRDPPNVELS